MAEKLRVLVIDDSSYNRQAITSILNSHPDIEVVDTAVDGEQGLKLARLHHPDLITLDIEMPRMDGFTFLRLLMSQMPIPVIVVSSHARKQEVFQALELGALDFVAKPARFFEIDESPLRKELISKALAVRNLEIVTFREHPTRATPVLDPVPPDAAPVEARRLEKMLLLGASTGGPPALHSLLKALGDPGTTAVLIAQHMPEKFTRAFAERLNRVTGTRVSESVDGEVVEPGRVFVATGGSHLEVVHVDGVMRLRVLPRIDADSYVPSIDRLFSSAAREFPGRIMGMVLTGMGVDGAEGVRMIRRHGGTTLAESRETAIVYGMPKVAIETGCVDHVLPLDGLIAAAHRFTRGDA